MTRDMATPAEAEAFPCICGTPECPACGPAVFLKEPVSFIPMAGDTEYKLEVTRREKWSQEQVNQAFRITPFDLEGFDRHEFNRRAGVPIEEACLHCGGSERDRRHGNHSQYCRRGPHG